MDSILFSQEIRKKWKRDERQRQGVLLLVILIMAFLATQPFSAATVMLPFIGMSVVYSNTVKHNRMTQVINALDGGSGNAILKIGTSGMSTTLVSITLAKPSASDTNGTMTFSGLPKSGTAGAAGTAAAAQLTDSAGVVIVDQLTVGTSGTNIIIDNTNIANGQTVNFNSGTITHG